MSHIEPTNQELFWLKKFPRTRKIVTERNPVDMKEKERRAELHRRRLEKFGKK